MILIALLLGAFGFGLMLLAAVLQYKATGDWGLLAIWALGVTVVCVALYPIRKQILKYLKDGHL